MRTLTILTGSSRGLGAALGRSLAAQGGHLVTVSRGESSQLARACAESNTRHTHLDVDLAETGAVTTAGHMLADLCAGQIRVRLIHNAGVVAPIALAHQLNDLEQINRAFQINITAPIYLTSQVLGATVSATDRRIMLISSGAGRSPTAGWGVYCATKAALDRYAEVVALEQGASLRIASVAPGVVDTGMQAEIRSTDPDRFPAIQRFIDLHAGQQLASPDAVAQRLLRLLESDQFGQNIIDDIRHYPS
jgi:NAD(P)-dependent dehydrogenase (short-subunit alcohol dehydrogenase family)